MTPPIARLAAGLIALAAPPVAAQAPPPAPAPLPAVQVDWGLRIPLRDGVTLAATRYRAVGEDPAPVPCVFTLTPYIAQSYHDRGMYFGANGYVFLTVDARGRGNSGGEFRPLIQEADDAHDVVAWLAAQPWCAGKVAMWGGSYAGHNQWAAARSQPRGLATIVPVASPFAGVDFPMQRNVFYSYDIQWLTLTAGVASQSMLFGDDRHWAAVYTRWYSSRRPFRELDRVAGMPSATFQEWLDHPQQGPYWDAYNPTTAEYAGMALPILSITGSYDGDQPGALEHYRRHLAAAPPAARDRHFLVIGPWDHAGTRTPQASFGGLTFGPASLVDMNALHKAWYDWTMKDGPCPAFLRDRVVWYLAGAETWRHASTLEAVTAGRRTLYLDSSGSANDVFASGSLGERNGRGPADRYVHDPRDVVAAELAADTAAAPYTDQRAEYLNRGKSLVYHSAPLAADTDIAGQLRFEAWIAIDTPDADIGARVFEVRADGGAIFLGEDHIRARYRANDREAAQVPSGRVQKYDFDRFPFNARRLVRGSRLRLVVGPLDSPYWQRNWHGGGEVAAESEADARTLTLTLHHDARYPSALHLPLAAASPD